MKYKIWKYYTCLMKVYQIGGSKNQQLQLQDMVIRSFSVVKDQIIKRHFSKKSIKSIGMQKQGSEFPYTGNR